MASRAAAGKAAKRHGDTWEDTLALHFRCLPSTLMVKVPTPVRRLRQLRGGQFIGVFHKRSSVDFVGMAYGLTTFIEAKSTTNSMRFSISAILPHQLEMIADAARLGAVSGVALYSPSGSFWISAAEIDQAPKSFRFCDLRPWDGGRVLSP